MDTSVRSTAQELPSQTTLWSDAMTVEPFPEHTLCAVSLPGTPTLLGPPEVDVNFVQSAANMSTLWSGSETHEKPRALCADGSDVVAHDKLRRPLCGAHGTLQSAASGHTQPHRPQAALGRAHPTNSAT